MKVQHHISYGLVCAYMKNPADFSSHFLFREVRFKTRHGSYTNR